MTVVKRVNFVIQKLHGNICKQDDETELKNRVETLYPPYSQGLLPVTKHGGWWKAVSLFQSNNKFNKYLMLYRNFEIIFHLLFSILLYP